jgi:hypothetical protein
MTAYVPPMRTRDRAKMFLLDYLKDKPQGAWRADIVAALPEGIGLRTLEKAVVELGIERQSGGRTGSIWRLPKTTETRKRTSW